MADFNDGAGQRYGKKDHWARLEAEVLKALSESPGLTAENITRNLAWRGTAVAWLDLLLTAGKYILLGVGAYTIVNWLF